MNTLGIFLAFVWVMHLIKRDFNVLEKRISKLEADIYDLKNPPKDYYNE